VNFPKNKFLAAPNRADSHASAIFCGKRGKEPYNLCKERERTLHLMQREGKNPTFYGKRERVLNSVKGKGSSPIFYGKRGKEPYPL